MGHLSARIDNFYVKLLELGKMEDASQRRANLESLLIKVKGFCQENFQDLVAQVSDLCNLRYTWEQDPNPTTTKEIVEHNIRQENHKIAFLTRIVIELRERAITREQKGVEERKRVTKRDEGLRTELNQLKPSLSGILFQNLELALEELEKEGYILCSMLSARATIYMVDKIRGAGGNKDEDKVKKLIELEVIDKDESNSQTKKAFLDACRSARNILMHDITILPKAADAHKLFGSTILMARIYKDYEQKREN